MTSIDLQTVSLAAGDTAPHGMDELYNVQFTDGTYSPASGAISLNDFRNKTIGTPSTTVQTKTFSYTGLTNLLGTSNRGGTWRGHTFTTWTLPSGFSSNSPNFSVTVNVNGQISGSYFVSGEHYGSVGIVLPGGGSSTIGTSALAPSRYGPTAGVNGATYNWTRTKTTLNDPAYTLSAGDTVNIQLYQYVEYWKTLDIEYIITW